MGPHGLLPGRKKQGGFSVWRSLSAAWGALGAGWGSLVQGGGPPVPGRGTCDTPTDNSMVARAPGRWTPWGQMPAKEVGPHPVGGKGGLEAPE